ncbi:MAG: VanZ family protein [Bacteroidetes bacterium]|nr:MAG: VanZ family protein [Bacteroidota bacterium]REK04880.1 MAG: VanZ family protein [Bacteroidota bacterium]REK36352.1 MAG: VanZ family protein [Bacteroidota bacterium]REK50982.1 MAG: VanZ family protein [Bacteroidota bacterium]
MFRRLHLPLLLWAAVIFVICAIPGNNIPKLSFLEWLRPDKIVHLIVFGILSVFIYRSVTIDPAFAGISSRAFFWSVLISSIYGALIEYLQYSVFINRSGDIRDAAANAIGAWLGMLIYIRYLTGRRKEKS